MDATIVLLLCLGLSSLAFGNDFLLATHPETQTYYWSSSSEHRQNLKVVQGAMTFETPLAFEPTHSFASFDKLQNLMKLVVIDMKQTKPTVAYYEFKSVSDWHSAPIEPRKTALAQNRRGFRKIQMERHLTNRFVKVLKEKNETVVLGKLPGTPIYEELLRFTETSIPATHSRWPFQDLDASSNRNINLSPDRRAVEVIPGLRNDVARLYLFDRNLRFNIVTPSSPNARYEVLSVRGNAEVSNQFIYIYIDLSNLKISRVRLENIVCQFIL